MLKVVVFDGGWGGEVVANYLSQELSTVEIIRVIDWYNAPYDDKTLSQIVEIARELLSPFIGKVDLIVLGGYTVSLAVDYLRALFPRQRFIGTDIACAAIPAQVRRYRQIVVLANEILLATPLWKDLQQNLPYSTLILPDSSGWENLINNGEMSVDLLRRDLQVYFQVRENNKRPNTTRKAPMLATAALGAVANSRSPVAAQNGGAALGLWNGGVAGLRNGGAAGLRHQIMKFLNYDVSTGRKETNAINEPKLASGIMWEAEVAEVAEVAGVAEVAEGAGGAEVTKATEETRGAGVAGEVAEKMRIASTGMVDEAMNLASVGMVDRTMDPTSMETTNGTVDLANIETAGRATDSGYSELIKPEAIIVLNTHLWDFEDELAEIFGGYVPILDFRERLLHDVCLALKLRGLDGKLDRGVI